MVDILGILTVETIAKLPYSEECQLCNRFFWFSFYKNHTHIPHECIIYDLTLSNTFPLITMQSTNIHTMNKSSPILLRIQVPSSLQDKLFVSEGAVHNFTRDMTCRFQSSHGLSVLHCVPLYLWQLVNIPCLPAITRSCLYVNVVQSMRI